jgi:hypothetical protein
MIIYREEFMAKLYTRQSAAGLTGKAAILAAAFPTSNHE